MGNTVIRRPMGASGDPTGDTTHGDVVVEALSRPVRILIGAVLLTNLTLGAWFVSRSDFSGLMPKSAAEAPQIADTKPTAPYETERSSPRLTFATTNERD